MTFSREVRHDGLKRSRIIHGPDPHYVQRKARAQLDFWESLWALFTGRGTSATGGWSGPEPENIPSTDEEGHRIAAILTAEAQKVLEELGEIFPGRPSPGTPNRDDLELFQETPPEQPHLPDPKPRPLPTEQRFQPKLSFFDRLVPGRRRMLEKEAATRFQKAWAAWYEQEREVQEALAAHQTRFEEWDRRRSDFEAEHRRLLGNRKECKGESDLSDPSGIIDHFSSLLASARLPAWFPREAAISVEENLRILNVDYRLPALEDVPSLASVTYRDDQGGFLEEHLSDADHTKAYDSVVYQFALRTVKEILSDKKGQELRAVTFNGWVDALDLATGRKKKIYLATLEAERDRFAQIVPDRVSPQACFRAMGGVCVGHPHQVLATPPIRASAREDSGTSEAPADKAGTPDPDLTATSAHEFRQLMVGILEQKLMPDGGDLQVTVVREDGSLEAIGRSPVSEGSRVVIFHVMRSVAPVAERPMRDLLDRMTRENAVHGVFLTTGHLTSGARDLARGKSVSLFDGDDLVQLLKFEPGPDLPPPGEPLGDQDYMGLRPQ
jgi:restriction system protein